nr:sn-glycerol-3-phosphate ABC transporter ATP-binding protein UgpC [uncultured Bacillus sp.]
MAGLQLQHVHKVYHNVTAIKDCNLDIQDKEFIVFVGPSGCGKSTILRVIAGLEKITEGDLFIDGQRMNDIPPKDRDIAMVFQNYALYPHLTVYQNMAFGLKNRKFPKGEIEHRVMRAARILGLERYLDRKPKALSGGQQQRVALGRAIVRDAKVFLMDEPLSNLDAKLRVQMRAEIIQLHQRLQTTFIYVTHDQTEAMTMATRLVVMKNGIIQQAGDPKEVYNKPNNVFVGGFIGSPAMNFFMGILTEAGFKIGHTLIKIPDKMRRNLQRQGYVNKEIILGIRPEDLYVESNYIEKHKGSVFEVTIEVIEFFGAETIVYTHIADQQLAVRLNPQQEVKSGQVLTLRMDMNKVHFFDVETEDRVLIDEGERVLQSLYSI